MGRIQKRGSFRPLAGFWFLNFVVSNKEKPSEEGVSVPLRGSGS